MDKLCERLDNKLDEIMKKLYNKENNMTAQASDDSRGMDIKDLRANIGGNKDSVLTELPILLDISIPDSGSNNDIKDKDTTRTELKSTLDITSSDYDIKTNKDYQSTPQPILLDTSESDSGCYDNNSSGGSNTNLHLKDSDFDQVKLYRDDVTDLDDWKKFDVANESATDIFFLFFGKTIV